MSDRAGLFLFSVLMIIAGIGGAVWLVVSGQAASVDGLFLLLTALLVALVFVLYLVYMIRRAMEAQAQPAAASKTGAAAVPAKRAPTAAAPPQATEARTQ